MLVKSDSNEVLVLSSDEVKACSGIAKAVHGAWSSGLKRDEFINLASDKLVELTGTQPDYEFCKAVSGQVIQDLINSGLAVDSANTYMGYIFKQAVAKHSFVKPSKDTKDGKRMSEKREAIKQEFEHVSLENITKQLLEVNQKLASDIMANKQPSKDDKALSSKLKTAQDMKLGKLATEQKEKQKGNIEKYRKDIDALLKIQTGFKKDGSPMFSWSISKLNFVFTCLQNEEKIKTFLSTK